MTPMRRRIYLETMEDVLSGSNKVLLEKGQGSGVLPYLPLPALKPAAPAAAPQAPTGAMPPASTDTGITSQGTGKS